MPVCSQITQQLTQLLGNKGLKEVDIWSKKGYHWVIDQFVDSQKLIGHRFDLFPLKLAHQVMKNIWIHLFIRISTKI